jgi:alkanesulfonate monooxygenase SsuD/methylene tetrahydromethanopterin reductase-like flavin-dependent oxidoreductase (luciferase family)
MRISLFIPQHWLPSYSSQRTAADHYREAVEQAVAADESGFDTVWIPEHQFVKFLAAPAPLPLLVKLAERTRHIRIGTACLVLPYYHPLRLASEIAAVDALTDGRLELGFGRGAWAAEYAPFGQTLEESRARFQEAVDILLGAWTQEDFSFKGAYTSFPPATIPFRPVQQPHPPIWIAAQKPDSVAWSVRRGFNVLSTPNREPFSAVERAFQTFRDAVAAADLSVGTPRPKIGISRMAFLATSDRAAQREAPAVLANHRLKAHLHDNCCPVVGGYAESGPVPTSHRWTMSLRI